MVITVEGVITRVVIIAIEDEMRRPPMRRTDSLVVVGSWRKGRWVTAHLREHVIDKDDICLISDRHASIKPVVANERLGWQPPHVYHIYCVRHITSNFNHKFKNEKQKHMLKKLSKI